jgi:hypothetical protein
MRLNQLEAAATRAAGCTTAITAATAAPHTQVTQLLRQCITAAAGAVIAAVDVNSTAAAAATVAA